MDIATLEKGKTSPATDITALFPPLLPKERMRELLEGFGYLAKDHRGNPVNIEGSVITCYDFLIADLEVGITLPLHRNGTEVGYAMLVSIKESGTLFDESKGEVLPLFIYGWKIMEYRRQ